MIYGYDDGKLCETDKPSKFVNEKASLKSDNENFSLHVDPDDCRNIGEGGGYFKWVNSNSFSKADKVARIMFSRAEYVHHTDHFGKKETTLNSKQKKELIKILKSPISKKLLNSIESEKLRNRISTGWEYLIFSYNSYLVTRIDIIEKYLDEPAYKWPANMISFDLPMPDYMGLPRR